MRTLFRSGVSCLALCGLLVAQGAASPADEQSAPVFRSSARLVVVDVIALDAQGKPVTGLAESNFKILEDGKEQKVQSFESHVSAPGAALSGPALPAGFYTNTPSAKPDAPLNILLFDVLNTPPVDVLDATQQMVKFVEKLPDGQPLALFFLGSRLRLVQSPTAKSEVLVAAVRRLGREKNSQVSDFASMDREFATLQNFARLAQSSLGSPDGGRLAARMYQAVKDETEVLLSHRLDYTVAAMEELAKALAAYPGRKNLIWLSETFPLSLGPDAKGGTENEFRNLNSHVERVHELSTALANAQVAVYPVDVRGLRNRGLDASADTRERGDSAAGLDNALTSRTKEQFQDEEAARATMFSVADETGGHAFVRTNDFGSAIQKTITDSATYYTLAYSPTSKKWNSQYRHIDVKVDKPGVRLEFRRGYYAFPEPARLGTQDSTKLLAAAMHPFRVPSTQLRFTARVIPDPADASRLLINYIVQPSDVTFTDAEAGKKSLGLDFMAVAWNDGNQSVARAADSLDTSISPQAYQAAQRAGVPASQELKLPAGKYMVRLGVIDRASQKTGVLDVPVTIP